MENIGIILQKENKYFKREYIGEVRCLCYKGDVKLLIVTDNNDDKCKLNLEGNFMIVGVHKSVYRLLLLKKKEKYEKYSDQINQLLDEIDGDFVYGNFYNYNNNNNNRNNNHRNNNRRNNNNRHNNKNRHNNNDDCDKNLNNYNIDEIINLHNTNIILYSKQAYNLIKSELNIDGDIHRIDFVKNTDTTFVINEIENSNFGNSVNNSVAFYDSLDKFEDNNLEDSIFDQEIIDFFDISKNFKSNREVIFMFE